MKDCLFTYLPVIIISMTCFYGFFINITPIQNVAILLLEISLFILGFCIGRWGEQ